jgi:hypothetical protein
MTENATMIEAATGPGSRTRNLAAVDSNIFTGIAAQTPADRAGKHPRPTTRADQSSLGGKPGIGNEN